VVDVLNRMSRRAAKDSFAPGGAHIFSYKQPRASPVATFCRRSAALIGCTASRDIDSFSQHLCTNVHGFGPRLFRKFFTIRAATFGG
jgi:hypothetical protein